MTTQSLTNLKVGDSARVARLIATGSMRRRLMDLGLIEGTRIWCAQKSPYGDPIAYAIRGAVIALRNEDAQNILVN